MQIKKIYIPSEKEQYMNSNQLQYFKMQLLEWKDELTKEAKHIIDNLKEESLNEPDDTDNATISEDIAIETNIQHKHSHVIAKIDDALKRIKNNAYGYCIKCAKPIGLKRLKANPITTLCAEEQEYYEKHRDKFSD